jgi:hypothetical protein
MSKYFGPKNHFFHPSKTRDHYALIFTWLFHKNKFVISSIRIAQESKKFQKMDMIDVQKSICRNLFVQIRRALGILRNFLGAVFVRPCVQ